jgi:hypothetical protein
MREESFEGVKHAQTEKEKDLTLEEEVIVSRNGKISLHPHLFPISQPRRRRSGSLPRLQNMVENDPMEEDSPLLLLG